MIRQYGPHRVQHGDVNKGISGLMGTDRVGIMYSDPPWGQGNIGYWATMNRKMTGTITVPADLDTFLSSIFGIAATYVDGYLLIEYGPRWKDMIQERGVAAGFTARGIIPIKYRGGGKVYPLDLHLFTRGNLPLPPGYVEHVSDTLGYETVKRAFYPLAETVRSSGLPNIGLDPCCGMGYTAQACIDSGLAFRGNELNAKRLAKTEARLQKAVAKAAKG